MPPQCQVFRQARSCSIRTKTPLSRRDTGFQALRFQDLITENPAAVQRRTQNWTIEKQQENSVRCYAVRSCSAAPRRAGSQHPEDAVEDTRCPLGARVAPIRQHRPDGGLFIIREFATHDSRLGFGGLNYAFTSTCNVARHFGTLPLIGHALDTAEPTRLTLAV